MRKSSLLLCAMGVTLWAIVLQTLPVAAHANYVRSIPAADSASPIAPQTVQAWFSEQVDPAASLLTVHDASGIAVDKADSHVAATDAYSLIISLKALSQGTYTVIWQTRSAIDGHLAKGSFTFIVGTQPAGANYAALVMQMDRTAGALQPPPLADTLMRWLTYIALVLVAGGFAFAPYIMTSPTLGPFRSATAARRRRLLWISLGLLGAALAAGVGLRAIQTGLASALSGRYGIVVLCRIVLIAVLAFMLRRQLTETRLVALPCALLLISQSALSHSAAEIDWLLPAVTDWLHLTSAAIWLGGVAMLAIVYAPVAVAEHPYLTDLGMAIRRFSPLAVGCVVVIYLTGILQSVRLLGSLDALFVTAYGRVLLVKMVLAVVLIGFGTFHQLFISPDLQSAKGKLSARAQRSGNQFRASIVYEAVVGLVVLLAVGALTALAPGRDLMPAADTPINIQTKSGDDLALMVGVTPYTVGANEFAVRVTDMAGDPAPGVESVVVRFRSLSMDMGISELVMKPYDGAANGYYTAQSSVLSMDGPWEAELIVRRAGKADTDTLYNLSVRF
jgi:copper transport protein